MRPSTGHDGKVYRGVKSLRARKESVERSATDLSSTGVKKLLNMKWDHLGLNNYNSTIDVLGKLDRGGSRQLSTGCFAIPQKASAATQIEFNVYPVAASVSSKLDPMNRQNSVGTVNKEVLEEDSREQSNIMTPMQNPKSLYGGLVREFDSLHPAAKENNYAANSSNYRSEQSLTDQLS